MRKPIAVLAADIHIREDIPICRIDNYLDAQWKKISFILNLAVSNDVPLLVAGDFGNKPYWSNRLLNKAIKILLNTDIPIIVIPGQHDLPSHSLDLLSESGIGVLHEAAIIDVRQKIEVKSEVTPDFLIAPFPYGIKITSQKFKTKRLKVAISHQLIVQNKKREWQESYPVAKRLLKDFPEYDLILTGDNHESFVEQYDKRLLVNPGSIMRMSVDQIGHKPRVYLWYSNNTVEPVYLPIEDNVIDITYKERKNDKQIEKLIFMENLKKGYEICLSFRKNMEEYFKKNKVHSKVERKVWKSINSKVERKVWDCGKQE